MQKFKDDVAPQFGGIQNTSIVSATASRMFVPEANLKAWEGHVWAFGCWFVASQVNLLYAVPSVFWYLNGILFEIGQFYCRTFLSQRLFGICAQEMVAAQAVRFSFSRLRQSLSTEW